MSNLVSNELGCSMDCSIQQAGDNRSKTIFLLALFLQVAWGFVFRNSITAAENYDARYVLHVHDSIDAGRKYLGSITLSDGSYQADGFFVQTETSTALPCLARLKCGTSVEDPSLKATIAWLRGVPVQRLNRISDLSLCTLVETTLNSRDHRERLTQLLTAITAAQLENGGWPNVIGEPRSNLSASQFALLALQEADSIGIEIETAIWNKIESYWRSHQLSDGGWPELQARAESGSNTSVSHVSGTLAGVAALKSCEVIQRSRAGFETPCDEQSRLIPELQMGIRWLESAYAKRSLDPQIRFPVDHLYSLEKMTRRSGDLFEGEEIWRREGALDLLFRQDRVYGSWPGNNQSVSTSYALLFLVSGTAPSVINSLQLTGGSTHKNLSGGGVWSVNAALSQAARMTRILTPRDVDLVTLANTTGLEDPFMQAPALFLSSDSSLNPSEPEILLLKKYIEQGGVIIGSARCKSVEFEESFKRLANRITANEWQSPDTAQSETQRSSQASFLKLSAAHPLYQLVHTVDSQEIELWELNDGCRTTMIFSHVDLETLWEKIPANRAAQVNPLIESAKHLGINLMVYLSARQNFNTRNRYLLENSDSNNPKARGAFEIGMIDHQSSLGVQPRLLFPLLRAANRTFGPVLSTAVSVKWTDDALFYSPVLYWVGKQSFVLTSQERDQLANYVQRGGVILVESGCRSEEFDRAFRKEMDLIFGNHSLSLIPEDHEIYSQQLGHEIHEVQVARYATAQNSRRVRPQLSTAEPTIEGIKIRGRYAVIYSPFDLLCSMQSGGTNDCEGYSPADSLKIGLNLISYALTQDLSMDVTVEANRSE